MQFLQLMYLLHHDVHLSLALLEVVHQHRITCEPALFLSGWVGEWVVSDRLLNEPKSG